MLPGMRRAPLLSYQLIHAVIQALESVFDQRADARSLYFRVMDSMDSMNDLLAVGSVDTGTLRHAGGDPPSTV